MQAVSGARRRVTSAWPVGWPPSSARGRRAVILAGGEAEPVAFVRTVVTADDLVIAADGGARMALAAGVVADLLVGDEDSIRPEELAALPPQTLRWKHPAEKDWSDLELAMEAAFHADVGEIVVLGALGGRLDHLLVNVGLLHLAHARGTPTRLLSARGEAFMLEGTVEVSWPVDRLVTLVALSPEVKGVSLEGFAYPLHDGTLTWGSSRGLSNLVKSAPARISVGQGRLLVVAGARQVRTVVTRTYLEMRSRDAAVPGFATADGLSLSRVEASPPAFYRYLYGEAGRDYHWTDRSDWTDATIRSHLSQSGLSLWVLYAGGAPAGWFELQYADSATQIAYFGLLPGFIGRGLGRHLLSLAIERAWEIPGTERVWLHTCTLDDEAALPNYLKRGFVAYREENYTTLLSG